MAMSLEIRNTLNFEGLELDRPMLLQAFALESDLTDKGKAPVKAAFLSQRQGKDEVVVGFTFGESADRFFFEIRNCKIVLVNKFQMLESLDFKPAENHECLRCALYVLQNRCYKNIEQYKSPLHLPPCLGHGVSVPSLDTDLLKVYMEYHKHYLTIYDNANTIAKNVFKGDFYKHVKSTSEFALQNNEARPEYWCNPFLSGSGYLVTPNFTENVFELLLKDKDMCFFRLDIGELNWIFYCVLTKQNKRISQEVSASELREFYSDKSHEARLARYLGLQVYHETIFNLIEAKFAPTIINGHSFVFALKKLGLSEQHIERAANICYSRIRNIMSATLNKRMQKLNRGEQE